MTLTNFLCLVRLPKTSMRSGPRLQPLTARPSGTQILQVNELQDFIESAVKEVACRPVGGSDPRLILHPARSVLDRPQALLWSRPRQSQRS